MLTSAAAKARIEELRREADRARERRLAREARKRRRN
jgi:hypothetical protein